MAQLLLQGFGTANLPSNGLLADVHILQVPMIRRSVLQVVVALRGC